MKPPPLLGVKAARSWLLLQLTTRWKGHTADTKEKEEITRRDWELLAILSGQRRRHRSRDQPCSMAMGSRLWQVLDCRRGFIGLRILAEASWRRSGISAQKPALATHYY